MISRFYLERKRSRYLLLPFIKGLLIKHTVDINVNDIVLSRRSLESSLTKRERLRKYEFRSSRPSFGNNSLGRIAYSRWISSSPVVDGTSRSFRNLEQRSNDWVSSQWVEAKPRNSTNGWYRKGVDFELLIREAYYYWLW